MNDPHGSRRTTSLNQGEAETKLLLVVDRRTVISRCLCVWIRSLGPEFHPIAVASLEDSGHSDTLSRASGVILCTGSTDVCEDEWLGRQVAWVHANRPQMPLALLAEAHELRAVEAAVRHFHLSGYIPTSSSLELAATALRLIIAGGHYIPQEWRDGAQSVPVELGTSPSPRTAAPAPCAKLTTRERSVLDLLERGLPNKIIGYRLGMSQSTVKAHVHNIIVKLNVRNRTEAAVARYATLASSTSPALPAPVTSLIQSTQAKAISRIA